MANPNQQPDKPGSNPGPKEGSQQDKGQSNKDQGSHSGEGQPGTRSDPPAKDR